MLKRNIFKILAIVFFLLSGATFIYSNKTTPKKIINDVPVVKKIISPSIIPSPTLKIMGQKFLSPTMVGPTQTIVNLTNIPTSTPIQLTPTDLTTVDTLTVSLSINSSSVGSIDLSNGANQCDVLSQALSQGKIQSLNMRYNNDMGTNAVYQINGIGKENAVWWGFKVNGLSPSQGCSYLKVNSGDNVLWEYVGN